MARVGPEAVGLFCTPRCNYKCRFCMGYETFGRENRPKEMSVSVVESILRMFPSIKQARLGGHGEPLLCENLSKIIDLLHRKQKRVIINTNGSLVESLADKIHWNHVHEIYVSVNEADPAIYKETTGVDKFDTVMRGIEFLKKQGRITVLAFVVDRSNVLRLPEYIRLARDVGASKVTFMSLIGGTVGIKSDEEVEQFWSKTLVREDTETMRLLSDMKKLVASKSGYRGQIRWPVPLSRRYVGRGCNQVFRYLAVDGSGNIAPCCRGVGPRAEWGNIDQGADVWRDEKIVTLRNLVRTRSSERPLKCSMCEANWSGF